MEITIENIYTDRVKMRDLGIDILPQEIADLLPGFTADNILRSQDLPSAYNDGYIQINIDSTIKTYDQLVEALSAGLTKYEHESLDTLKHSLSEQSFFQVERDENDDVQKIVYYKDGTLGVKIREDEIVRDVDGDVIQMIKRQYDANNSVVITETQTINRVDGDVVSIETVTT